MLSLAGAKVETPIAMETITALFKHQRRLNFRPGEGFAYSNGRFEIAAAIFETLRGATLAELYQEYLFGPLGMSRTVWSDFGASVVEAEATWLFDPRRPTVSRHARRAVQWWRGHIVQSRRHAPVGKLFARCDSVEAFASRRDGDPADLCLGRSEHLWAWNVCRPSPSGTDQRAWRFAARIRVERRYVPPSTEHLSSCWPTLPTLTPIGWPVGSLARSSVSILTSVDAEIAP